MSDYLFARPSFFEGVGRNIDFYGALNEYNSSRTAEEADARAYLEDVATLRKDMKKAIDIVFGK